MRANPPADLLNGLSAGTGQQGADPLAVGADGFNANAPAATTTLTDLVPASGRKISGKPTTKSRRGEISQTDTIEQQSVHDQPLRGLELPGLPAIPLAVIDRRPKRTNRHQRRIPSSPRGSWRVVLLRLLPSGQEALKPFGYDLFEGVPSTFAPVSDIQVPIDYIVGPGDKFRLQLYGNESVEI